MTAAARAVPAALTVLLLAGPAPAAEALRLAIVAPGQPGSPEEAEPVLTRFADWLAARLGRPAGSVSAVYHPDAGEGRAELESGADYALLPPALLLAWERDLGGLTPLAVLETEEGALERYALVRPRGAPAGLSGVTVEGTVCVDARFVRRVVLAGVPGAAASEPVFARRTLSALRALPGAPDRAVLLDAAQAGALPSLPFAGELEIVHRSRELPRLLLVALERSGRPPQEREAVVGALLALHESEEGAALAEEMRTRRFAPADPSALAELRALYRDGSPPGPP